MLPNRKPDQRSGSPHVPNFELDFGPVRKGSGSNHGSELNLAITSLTPSLSPLLEKPPARRDETGSMVESEDGEMTVSGSSVGSDQQPIESQSSSSHRSNVRVCKPGWRLKLRTTNWRHSTRRFHGTSESETSRGSLN
jgi:hypothetical protein